MPMNPDGSLTDDEWTNPNSTYFTTGHAAESGNWRFNKEKGEWEPGNANMDMSNGITNFLAPGAIPPDISKYPSAIKNQDMWSRLTQAGAQASPNANPYSTIVANQARPAQEALYQQMQAQQAGPSIAAMQGQRAQGQNVQAALAAGGGHNVMRQAGNVGAGLASDTGMGRLAEQLRGSQGIGGMATGVRAADLGVAGAQSQAGLQQRGLDDAMRQFYATQGSGLNTTVGRNALEKFKLEQRLAMNSKEAQKKSTDGLIQTGATFFGMGM